MIRLALALTLLAFPAAAQPRQLCAPRAALLEKLGQEFGETPTAGGVDGGGNLMEILAGPNGSWTLLIVRPDKVACIVGSGEGWLVYEPTVPGRGA